MNSLNSLQKNTTCPPLSPSKRGVLSNCPNSEAKRQKQEQSIPAIAKDIIVQTEIKIPSLKNLQLRARIAEIKAKQKETVRSLASYVVERDLEGLKAAFNPLSYHIDNQNGLIDLRNVINMIDLISEEDQELALTFAELLIQIEDLELLRDAAIQEFFELIIIPPGHSSLPLCVVCRSKRELEKRESSALVEYRSPIKRYSLLHYAANYKITDLYLWLLYQRVDLTRSEDGDYPYNLLFKAIGRSNDTPSELALFSKQAFSVAFYAQQVERTLTFCYLLQEAISSDAYQFATLMIYQMESWHGKFEEWRNEITPYLQIEERSLGYRALLNGQDENLRIDDKDSQDRTLLHWAVAFQNIKLIKELIHKMALDHVDRYGRTALHYAACIPNMDPNILRLLIERNPSTLFKKDYLGGTAIELALSGNLYENSRVLLGKMQSKPDMISPCLWYAATNDVAKFREITEKHSPYSEGIFALHTAIALGHREIIQACLEHSTFWHVPDKFGYTPLSLAVTHGDAEIIAQIVNHRARFGSPFKQDEIIALIQLSMQHPHKIETILQNLPLETLQKPNEDNLNPLQIAEIYSGPGVAQTLLEGFVRVKKFGPHSQSY